MTITRANVRSELYNTVPGLGFAGTADSVATGSITDTFALQDSSLGTNHYRDLYIYRPGASAPDDTIKKALLLTPTTGVLTHSGSNYSDTSTLAYEIVGPLHPDELNACITRAMRYVYYETLVPLSGLVTNGDMESGTTGWTGTNCTVTSITTAASVFSGTSALRGANSSSNGYAASDAFKVSPYEPFYASAIVMSTVGTAELVVYDRSNSAVIGSAITSGESKFMHLWCYNTIPASCESVELRLRGTESNADLVWNHAVFYPLNNLQFAAPSWLNEPYKFLKLREASYMSPISNQSNGGYDDGKSQTFKDWYQPAMFSLDPLKLDANQYKIQLMRNVPRAELWVHGKRPYSDSEDLSTEASTSNVPLNLISAYARLELAKVLRKRYPTDKRWEALLAEASEDVSAETTSRPEIPMQPLKQEYWGRA